jgi:hypothetical protein
MPGYAVESTRQEMTATGIVEPVTEWEETPDGRRRPSDKQARNADTGMPLWAGKVLYIQTAFVKKSTATAKVTVATQDVPKPAPPAPIDFSGLRVDVRINKSAGFVEVWSAQHAQATKPSARSGTEKAAA